MPCSTICLRTLARTDFASQLLSSATDTAVAKFSNASSELGGGTQDKTGPNHTGTTPSE